MPSGILGQDGFNLEKFRGSVRNVARPYLFYVQIPDIKGNNINLDAGASGDTGYITFLVRSTSVPKRSVSNLEVSWQGYKYSYGGVSAWEDWSCKFLLDSNMQGFNALRKWIHMVHDPLTNVHGNPMQYATDSILIQQLRHDKESGEVLRSWRLIGAWPKEVSGYDLDYSNVDTAATFDITLSYVYCLDLAIDADITGRGATRGKNSINPLAN